MSVRFKIKSETLIFLKIINKFYSPFDRQTILNDQHSFFID